MSKKAKLENHVVVFKDQEIRRVFHEEAWWFVIADIITVLTGTSNASDYVKKMRNRDESLSKGWGQIATEVAPTSRTAH